MVVHLGKEDFLPRYKLYVAHIAEWRQQFQNVQSVDLRYEGQVIVNPDKPAEENPPREARRHGRKPGKCRVREAGAEDGISEYETSNRKASNQACGQAVVKKATR